MLSRLDNIADDTSGTTKYVEYDYFGASNVFKVRHPAVTNELTLDYDGELGGTGGELGSGGTGVRPVLGIKGL